MKGLIEEMQKTLKKERIVFNGFIELEQQDSEEQKNQKGKLSKPIQVSEKRSK